MNLKQLLEGKEVDFVIDYLGPLQDFPKKDGGTYEAHEGKLRTTSNGEVYDNRFFSQQASTLKVGDMVRGYLNAKGYPAFDKVSSGEPRNNAMEVRKERAMASEKNEVVISQIACNFMGNCLAGGSTAQEAYDKSRDAYYLHEKLVKEIISGEAKETSQFGF